MIEQYFPITAFIPVLAMGFAVGWFAGFLMAKVEMSFTLRRRNG